MPIATPFYSRLAEICPNHHWVNWSGRWGVSQFGVTHDHEYFSIRDSAGLMDTSPLRQYDVIGKDAEKLINRVIPRDISKCKVGQIFYTPWCDDDGKMIDDGPIWRIGDQHFRVNSADPHKKWFEDCAFMMDVEVTDITDSMAALALQGPKSRAILSQLVDPEAMAKLKFFHLFETQVDGYDVAITRTGYTGDLGYEIWMQAENAEKFWDRIIPVGEDYGMTPQGLTALDQTRIEAGLPMLEVDYFSANHAVIESEKTSPYELGLGWAVNLKKKDFIGRTALAKEKENESATSLKYIGIEIDWLPLEAAYEKVGLPPQVSSVPCREGTPVYKGSRHIGKITSKCYSQILKKYIGLASIEKQYAVEGCSVDVEITVDYVRKVTNGTVSKLPFYSSPLKRGV